MADNNFALVLAAALSLALAVAAVSDWRSRTIPNWLNLIVAAGAPLWWWAFEYQWPAIGWQFALAIAVFVAFTLLFAAGAMGGGDVKLLTALALWFPPVPFLALLVVMSLLGGVLTLLMLVRHRVQRAEGRVEVPYGIAIAVAGLWGVSQTVF